MSSLNHKRILRIGTALTSLLLWLTFSACGVRIEVAPAIVPGSVTSTTNIAAPIADLGLTRLVASPRIAFTDDGQAQVQLFMTPNLPDAYLIVGHTLQLAVQYDSAWFGDQPGSARIHLSIATRLDAQHPWRPGDSTEQPLTSATVPAVVNDVLSVYVTPDIPGNFEVRAEVEIVVYPEKKEALNRIESSQLQAMVFSDPGVIPLNLAALNPLLGTLNGSTLLFDWRGWLDPCTAAKPVETIYPAYQNACKAFTAHHIPALIDTLQTVHELLTQPEALAQIADTLGLIAAASSNWPEAAGQFGRAADIWQMRDKASAMAISRQNQIVALAMVGNAQPGILAQLLELHDQLTDDSGRFIIQANWAHLSDQRDQLDEANSYFVSNNLPQAAITKEWLRQINVNSTAIPPG
jgi:hypothetical protein